MATDLFICDTSTSVAKFYILFFEATSCTQYYVDNGEDKKHEIYGDGTGRSGDCSEDCIAFYSYRRSTDREATIWTCKE